MCGLNDEQSALVLCEVETFNQRVDANAGDPHHAGSFDLSLPTIVFQRERVLRHSRDARLCMHLDPTFIQRAFDVLADRISHSGHKPIGHLNNDHAGLAL